MVERVEILWVAGVRIRKFSAHIIRQVCEELRRAEAEQPYLDR